MDYFLLVAKVNDNNLISSCQFLYSKLQNLFNKDLNERLLGMFTFNDSGETCDSSVALATAGIKIAEEFKFNNIDISSISEGTLTESYDSFRRLMEYIEK